MNKKKIIGLAFLGSVFISLAILFFFYDLEISKLFASENPNFLFRLLDAIGEFPIYIGPIFFGLVYGFSASKKTTRLLSHFVGLIMTYVAYLRLVEGIFNVFFNSSMSVVQNILLSIVALLTYSALCIFVNRIDKNKLFEIRDIALIYLIVSAASFAIVTGMKYVWGRTRFRSLSQDYQEFTNFLTINGIGNGKISTEYRSFPSGHTNAATSVLVLGLLSNRFSTKKWIEYVSYGMCFLYALIVAISRVGVGAHYASDVLFGFGVSLCCFLITYTIFKKKGWLYVRSN